MAVNRSRGTSFTLHFQLKPHDAVTSPFADQRTMKLDLDEMTVGRMIDYVDRHVRRDGCDHTHRFASQWSREHNISWDDLLACIRTTWRVS